MNQNTLAIEVALIGLIGVIVGGLITGGFQLLLAWRKEQRARRQAKRLIDGELFSASVFLRNTTSSPDATWPYLPDATSTLSTSAWKEHRVFLADAVNTDLWNRLVVTYAELEVEQRRFTMASQLPSGTPLTEPVIKGMNDMVIQLERLRRALGGGGGSVTNVAKMLAAERKTADINELSQEEPMLFRVHRFEPSTSKPHLTLPNEHQFGVYLLGKRTPKLFMLEQDDYEPHREAIEEAIRTKDTYWVDWFYPNTPLNPLVSVSDSLERRLLQALSARQIVPQEDVTPAPPKRLASFFHRS